MTHDPMAPWPGARTIAPGAPLWRQDTRWKPVPIACRDREEALPHARGAPGSGGLKGPRNGNYKRGLYTAEAIASRRWLRQQIQRRTLNTS
jgi:hypothetical protein